MLDPGSQFQLTNYRHRHRHSKTKHLNWPFKTPPPRPHTVTVTTFLQLKAIKQETMCPRYLKRVSPTASNLMGTRWTTHTHTHMPFPHVSDGRSSRLMSGQQSHSPASARDSRPTWSEFTWTLHNPLPFVNPSTLVSVCLGIMNST